MKPIFNAVIAVSLLAIGYNTFTHSDDNFVWLRGIVSHAETARSLGVNYRGIPWSLHNATIMDYLDCTYNLIKILAFMRYGKTAVHNARNHNISFDQNGFMMITNQQVVDTLNEQDYEQHILRLLKQLFPKAKTLQMLRSIYRGTGDNNPIPFMHFDQVQTRESLASSSAYKEYLDVILSNRTLWLIGTWTPIQMKQNVCKDSLVLLDANTLLKEDIFVFTEDYTTKSTDGTILTIKGDVASVAYNKNHKFYYYPHMNNDEMIIFTHFRSDALKANAHTSFTPNDCNFYGETRKSVESRVLIQF